MAELNTMSERVVWDRTGDFNTGRSAAFDPSRAYRYVLTRKWGPEPPAVFIMRNPSGAFTERDGPTRRRCLAFARREGRGGLVTVNLFALLSPDPRALAQHPEPVGELNDHFILEYCTQPGALVVAAWGGQKTLQGRDRHVTDLLRDYKVPVRCLGVTKAGAPRHPLYVPADTPLTRYPAR